MAEIKSMQINPYVRALIEKAKEISDPDSDIEGIISDIILVMEYVDDKQMEALAGINDKDEHEDLRNLLNDSLKNIRALDDDDD